MADRAAIAIVSRRLVPVALAALAALAGSAIAQPPAGRLAPADRARCLARGGTVRRLGMLGFEGCVVRFRDGGRACTDRRQCQGACEYHGDWPPRALPAVGQCAVSNDPFGCRSVITKGRPGTPVCVD